MKRIRVLDEMTINKIAAGEVIENPASIIKELVENAIDAKATSITVEIEDGGKKLIRVTDNGQGIDKDDIPLAFERHSTSKLNTIDDLYHIETMGFRGEALASIAAVARVEMVTKTDEAQVGYRYIIENGQEEYFEELTTQRGTTIIVTSLFDHLPVRKKFLKQDHYEANLIYQLVSRFCFSHPYCAFTLIRNRRIVLKTVANERLRDRIYQVLGADIAKNMIALPEIEDNLLTGYISNNLIYRSNRLHQYISINKRTIKFPELVKAIEHRYRSVIPLQKHPIFILDIHIPHSSVDVNVHPNKTIVTLSENHQVISRIEKIISNTLRDHLNVPKWHTARNKTENVATIFDIYSKREHKRPESSIIEQSENIGFKDLEATIPDRHQNLSIEEINLVDENDEEERYLLLKDSTTSSYQTVQSTAEQYSFNEEKEYVMTGENEDGLPDVQYAIFVGQLFTTYLFYQVGDQLIILDQHAAHERIKYEYFLNKVRESKVSSQRLLKPLIFHLKGQWDIEDSDFVNLLSSLGYEIERFDEESIAIRTVPMILGEPVELNMVMSIFEEFFDDGGEFLNSIDDSQVEFKIEKIMKKSCISAIKAGKTMDRDASIKLLKELFQMEHPYTCPHGRPTILILSKTEFEKSFLRDMVD